MIAAIYARKSTEQNVAAELKSTATQISLARKFAESRGWKVSQVFEDDAISGAIENRPGVVALRDALAERPRPFDVLICADASRLGREALSTGYLLKKITEAGVRVVYYESGREPDLKTALGKFVAGVDNFAAEQYREAVAEKTRRALRERAERGEATSGLVYGYDNVREAGANGRPGAVRRVVNKQQAETVRRIFDLAAEGYGLLRIQNRLRAERVAAPAKSIKGWTKACVREFLYQELYRGRIIYGKTRNTGYTAEGKKTVERVPESEWIVV